MDFMEYADILFLSDEGIKNEKTEFILSIAKKYDNEIIVMGLGSKGALIYNKEDKSIYQINAVFTRPVVNTIGAGDSLFSSFIHYYKKGKTPIESLKRAVVFASYKIGEKGAASGFPNEDIINQFYDNIAFKINKVH